MSFPIYKQTLANDSGTTCLRMIASYYGKQFSIEYLNRIGSVSKDNQSLVRISDIAEKLKFRTSKVRLSWNQLFTEAKYPLIIHKEPGKNVVVTDVKHNIIRSEYTIKIVDPKFGSIRFSKGEFLKEWFSKHNNEDSYFINVLLLEPGKGFYDNDSENSKKITFSYFYEYIRPYKKLITQLFLSLLFGATISLIIPFLTQAVVDQGINNNDLSFVVLILVGRLILNFGELANSLIKSWIVLHVSNRISITMIQDFLTKLMKLPYVFFASRMTGDIMQRIGDHERIKSFLTGSLINMSFSLFNFIIYGIILATYHIGLYGILILGSVLNSLWVMAFMRKRKALDYKAFHASSENKDIIIQMIEGIQDIKIHDSNKQKRWEWEKNRANIFKVSIDSLNLNQIQTIGGTFINQTKNIFISYLSARAVILGDMTLGMMMAVQYIVGQINGPIGGFINHIYKWQDAKISLDRLNEIHQYNEEEDQIYFIEIPEIRKIEIKNLSFSYDKLSSKLILDKINIDFFRGKLTALVGESGSGKTTLIKLLLGLINPNNGEILLDNVKLSCYSKSEWRSKCGVVMQEGYIFSDTISRNIALADDQPNIDRVRLVSEIACINDHIESLPQSYETIIGSKGQKLSSGQKQRLLIARALYNDPEVLLLDEATSSLDTITEKKIMKNITDYMKFRTIIIIAHRLSTVISADNIAVLDSGKIIEMGSHYQLVKKRGAYYKLVSNQLNDGS